MSFFDDASLVMIPSGYKDQKVYSVKPTDGTGDLTFSRASSATRVQSDGLIEKVRTNLATYSSDFSAAGAVINATITTNTTTDPFGTSLADSLLETATTGNHIWYRDFTVVSGYEVTFSIFVKSIGGRNFRIAGSTGTGSELAVVDLANGAILASTGQVSVTNAGSGWYRISVTTTSTGTTVRFIAYAADGTSISYAGNITKGVFLFGHQLEYGVMTDYIATTTAAVSVGPVSGLPRLDYLNSSCPRLLLEPQRTNTSPYSEQFTSGWASSSGSPVTANTTISPSGYQDADTLAEASSGDYLFQVATSSSGTFTVSVFAKKGSSTNVGIGLVAGGFTAGMSVQFNFDTQTFATPTNHGSFTSISATSQNYGNGWYRLALTGTTASATTYFFVLGSLVGSAYAANVRLWGAQCEAAAYATSYIPTLGASVTRVADVASKTGISSLIGQTEGTLFVDFTINGLADYGTPISVNDGSTTNYIWLTIFANGTLRAELYNGAAQASITFFGPVVVGRYKMAFGYKTNDFVLYVNGALVGTDLTGTTFSGTTLSRVDTNLTNASVYSLASESINQTLLFKTRLTNAQLAELTA
jgi:hypothetical protein